MIFETNIKEGDLVLVKVGEHEGKILRVLIVDTVSLSRHYKEMPSIPTKDTGYVVALREPGQSVDDMEWFEHNEVELVFTT